MQYNTISSHITLNVTICFYKSAAVGFNSKFREGFRERDSIWSVWRIWSLQFLTVHELKQLVDDSLEELPVGSEEARILAHDVHDV